jgi:MATE family multidrug resistance protein
MNSHRDAQTSPIVEVLRLSWPASLAMLNSTVIKFIDGLMVSYVSPAALGAQFLGGMFAFIPESFAMGMLTVVNTFVAQNFGAGRFRQTGLYAWAGLLAALAFAVVIAPAALAAGPIFSVFGHPADVLALETTYFRYMAVSVLLTLPARVLEQFFFGIHRPRIVLVGSILASVVNVGANYVLIFGHLGFPAMGLEGAAIGSVLAWSLQLLVLVCVFLSGPLRRQFATHLPGAVRPSHVWQLLRIGWPAGLQLCNDISSWSLFAAWLVGRFGTAHLAATTIAMRYTGLSFMPAVGIGVATTALVGRSIGKGRPDAARRQTHAAILTAMVYMGLCAAAFGLLRHEMVSLFVPLTVSDLSADQAREMADQIVQIGGAIMIWVAIFQLFDAVGIVYIGALRGAGDTFWPMVVSIALSWGLVVGGGAVMVHFLPQFTSVGPWITASLYVIALGVVMAARFESGAWRHIDLLGWREVVPVLVGKQIAPIGPAAMPAVADPQQTSTPPDQGNSGQ